MECKQNRTFYMKAQSTLRKLGYYDGKIDGIYGPATKAAIAEFQRDYGIQPTGFIGDITCRRMTPYFEGYFTYTIKRGDTFTKIANRYGSTVQSIITANPNKNPNALKIGDKIIVPYGYPVVDTTINYSYDVLESDLNGLKARYPFLEVGTIGKSVLGRNLYYVRLGKGTHQVFYNGAHHSLEWITSPLLMKFTENVLKNYSNRRLMHGYDVNYIWNNSSIYIVPMVNPDGIDLVLNGLTKANPYYRQLIAWNNGSTDFSRDWQANNSGVDLNHNYDALWEESKRAEAELGITGPGPTRYGGTAPESEPESKAVANFTRNHDFRLVIAYHSQGEIIYWNFQNLEPPEARTIGEVFSRLSGYQLEEPVGISSLAGYKDWFISKFRRPGYTVEVGRGKNPLPITQLPKIYLDNEAVLLEASII